METVGLESAEIVDRIIKIKQTKSGEVKSECWESTVEEIRTRGIRFS